MNEARSLGEKFAHELFACRSEDEVRAIESKWLASPTFGERQWFVNFIRQQANRVRREIHRTGIRQRGRAA